MNDRVLVPARAPAFVVQTQTRTVQTESFGEVTLHAMNVRRFREVSASLDEKHPEEFGHRLLCEMAVGPNGERFTPADIDAFPISVIGDIRKLVDQCVLMCGHKPADAKKDSRTR
jgi:hypothetical protein